MFMKRISAWYLLVLLSGSVFAGKPMIAEPLPPQPWLRCDLKFIRGRHQRPLVIEKVPVANTVAKRRRGLSGRLSHGTPVMLFQWHTLKRRAFWMHDVHLSLKVAMMSQYGRVFQVVKMYPNTQHSHWSHRPMMYAFESTPAWFLLNGIQAGVKMKLMRCYKD